MSRSLRASKAPNLLIAPVDYSQQYQDQFSNALRLYFAALDNFTTNLMENSGGRYLNFPHIFASDDETQYADGNNVPTRLEWNTIVRAEGFSLNTGTDAAVATYSGAYRVEYRLQAENTDSAAHQLYAWMRVDGVDVENSCSKFTVPASAGPDSYIVCSGFIEAELYGGSYIQLVWATDKAATSGGGLGVYLEAYPAQVTPFTCPAVPSAYGSITFVSELSG